MPLGLASNRLQKRSFRTLCFEACALGENIMARTRPGPGRCRMCPGDLGPKPKWQGFSRLGVVWQSVPADSHVAYFGSGLFFYKGS